MVWCLSEWPHKWVMRCKAEEHRPVSCNADSLQAWMQCTRITDPGMLTHGAAACCMAPQAGPCREACKTTERAAEQIMGEHDTDVAEALFVVRMHS